MDFLNVFVVGASAVFFINYIADVFGRALARHSHPSNIVVLGETENDSEET